MESGVVVPIVINRVECEVAIPRFLLNLWRIISKIKSLKPLYREYFKEFKIISEYKNSIKLKLTLQFQKTLVIIGKRIKQSSIAQR